jgi:hypothetical protein
MCVASILGNQLAAWLNSSTVVATNGEIELAYKNTDAVVQAFDLIGFFNAENSVNVFSLTIHATCKPFDKKLPTKLSTVNVHERLGHNDLKFAFWEC